MIQGKSSMYDQDIEKKYRIYANRVTMSCVIAFSVFRIGVELIQGRFDSVAKMSIIATITIFLLLFLQKKNFKNIPFIIPFLLYIVYLGASFAVNSFEYLHDSYLLVLVICAAYFDVKNYLALFIVTQVINLTLNIFQPQLPNYVTNSVHFILMFSAGFILFIIVQFAAKKSKAISNAFSSFGALMRVTPNVLILVDGDSRIKYLSRSVFKILGIKEPENFVGKNFLELFKEDSVKELFSDIAKKRAFYEAYQKISVSGQIRTFNVFADKMSEEAIDGMFFMFNDVTEITRLKEIAEQDSLMDGLIQIPNRRAFNRQILQEWNRALRDKVNLSFLMIDIDFFKKYNDTYGHSQGDELLKTAGEVFKRCLKRSTDFVARFGGEEFGVLLFATNSFQANVIAERIREAIENEVIVTRSGEQTKFTVSIGVCTMIPNINVDHNFILEEADRALYKAKGSGRNQVQVATWENRL